VQELNEIRLIIGVAHKPVKGEIIIVLDYRNIINFIVYIWYSGRRIEWQYSACMRSKPLIRNHDPVGL
jgi:hypothetical protein